jgi:hypothetical protein
LDQCTWIDRDSQFDPRAILGGVKNAAFEPRMGAGQKNRDDGGVIGRDSGFGPIFPSRQDADLPKQQIAHSVAERGQVYLGTIADGKVAEFQVALKVGFKIER